ncbi:glycosyltransferase family 39 protein [Maridesulfovibrio sp.]|uniref:ArnT family glycosyltransferase n=1 Tax=Maridesulfovibrio sp. TaxID=2795000 RepID=UPI002A18B424|nr:glycosyltransferase family 39 protein [Maridesulfovibrio sp.]
MGYGSIRNHAVPVILLLAIVLFAGAVIVAVRSSMRSPENTYLAADGGASWIKIDEPFRLNARSKGSEMTLFRRFFTLDKEVEPQISLRAFRGAGIWLDGRPLRKFDGDLTKWRDAVNIMLPSLSSGKHELKIAVVNEDSHPALLVRSDMADLNTPDGWEASRDDFVWTPAVDAAKTGRLFIGDKFRRSDLALLELLPYLIPLFLLGAGFVWMKDKQRLPASVRKFEPGPGAIRFLLLGLWTIMAVNNFHDLPLKLGMDSTGHFKYIEYVAQNLKLPSPLEGWQMFQPPLYYIVSAIFYKILLFFTDTTTALYWLRFIPLVCGGIMIEITYRCSELVFPDDALARITATVIGGFMPMNFVMAQFWGNESFAAVFSALAIFMTLTIVLREDRRGLKQYLLLGFFAGCAVLSKATASLLIPLMVFFILLALHGEEEDEQHSARFNPFAGTGCALVVTAVTGGWYYLRNWMNYGKPFIGGWDRIREIGWWQDHGYRVWEHFCTFGSSVFKPVYSTVNGVWDGLYSTIWLDGNLSGVSRFASRPPWNDDLMTSAALLALIPSVLILVGIARTFRTPVRSVFNGRMFITACIVVYFTAITYLYLNLPVYSTAKGSYSLGLLPCYGILAADGIRPLTGNLYVRSSLCGFLVVWTVLVYGAYFV